MLHCSKNLPFMLYECAYYAQTMHRKSPQDYALILCGLHSPVSGQLNKLAAFFEHQCAAVHLLLPSAFALTPSMWGLEVG